MVTQQRHCRRLGQPADLRLGPAGAQGGDEPRRHHHVAYGAQAHDQDALRTHAADGLCVGQGEMQAEISEVRRRSIGNGAAKLRIIRAGPAIFRSM
jgi:hypothetical protein